ncbi:MAG: hypothetical protein SGARI_001548 [Bacillariaceae sp.]
MKTIIFNTMGMNPCHRLTDAVSFCTIDSSVDLAKEIQAHPNDVTKNVQPQEQLKDLLLANRNYLANENAATVAGSSPSNTAVVGFAPTTTTTTASTTKTFQPAKAYLDTYNRNRKELPLVFQPGALLVQNGEIDTWRRLKRQEAVREKQDDIRAALNAYTQALTYSADAYLLTVSSQERSKMVREDRLPDIKQVIASDMGMRYLVRNQLLTSMAEVKAELEYQLREQKQEEKPSTIDVSELLPLLLDAQTACNQWFGFIDPDQVQEAMRMVENKSKIVV